MLKIKFVLNLPSLNSNGIGLWCNGNTTVFGAVFQGSSPCRPTKKSRNSRDFLFIIQILLHVGPEVSGLLFPHLDFKRHHWSHRVVYQIFTDAAVKEVRETSATVRAHAN